MEEMVADDTLPLAEPDIWISKLHTIMTEREREYECVIPYVRI